MRHWDARWAERAARKMPSHICKLPWPATLSICLPRERSARLCAIAATNPRHNKSSTTAGSWPGQRLAVALDTYIHHFGSRTFTGMQINYEEKLKNNLAAFAAKWGP